MKCRTIAVVFVAVAVLSMCSFPGVAAAQSNSDAVRAMYQKSATVPTNIPGIFRFPDAPAGFDPVAASDLELGAYGFPPHPDAEADPSGYARWAHAMKMARNRWHGDLKPTGIYHGSGRDAKVLASQTTNKPGSASYSNWSGVILTNTLTKYSTKTSFYYVMSYWNVPFAQEAFNGDGGNVCDGLTDYVSVWNGIDGSGIAKAGNGDVLQAGTDSAVRCVDGTTTYYTPIAWIEWFPAGAIGEFDVANGDDMFVETVETSSTTGFLIVEDLTTQIYDLIGISAPSGTELVGSSAEWIVEQPCCEKGGYNGYYDLANYVMDFTFGGEAYNNNDQVFYAGSQATSTYLGTLYDGSTAISYPVAGTAGTEGDQGITFFDEGCAANGGCSN